MFVYYDMLPAAAKTFAVISKNLSQAQISEEFETLHRQNKGILIERGANTICLQNSVCAKPVFDYTAAQVEHYNGDNKNFIVPAVRNMTTDLLCANDEDIHLMLKKINSFASEVQDLFVSSYGRLYAKKPNLREVFWNKILQEASATSDFSSLYNNLGEIVSIDDKKIPQCLDKKHSYGKRSHYSVLNALKRFQTFLVESKLV